MKKILMVMMVCLMSLGFVGCNGKVLNMNVLDSKEFSFDSTKNISLVLEDSEEFNILTFETDMIDLLKQHNFTKKYNSMKIYVLETGSKKSKYLESGTAGADAIYRISIDYKQNDSTIQWNIMDKDNKFVSNGTLNVNDIK